MYDIFFLLKNAIHYLTIVFCNIYMVMYFVEIQTQKKKIYTICIKYFNYTFLLN
jgi:hypothetical protein